MNRHATTTINRCMVLILITLAARHVSQYHVGITLIFTRIMYLVTNIHETYLNCVKINKTKSSLESNYRLKIDYRFTVVVTFHRT